MMTLLRFNQTDFSKYFETNVTGSIWSDNRLKEGVRKEMEEMGMVSYSLGHKTVHFLIDTEENAVEFKLKYA